MKVELRNWSVADGWSGPLPADASFVLTIASGPGVHEASWRDDLAAQFGETPMMGCSTAGNISGTQVHDGGAVACFVSLEKSTARVVQAPITAHGEDAGRTIGAALADPSLRHVFVLADGLSTNGSLLARALQAELPPGVTVSGGLAGDGDRFEKTHVWTHTHAVQDGVVALGLYGDAIRVGFGSEGGWRPFGPERRITKSDGNRLHQLENQSALELYKQYLGDQAEGLPATGLSFPLSVRTPDGDSRRLVRTLLKVDPEDDSMVFAGDLPEGSYARLMHTGNDGLISGAERAAEQCATEATQELALLVSCVGRRLVLTQQCEDELEAVAEILGTEPHQFGFYSYGELCPRKPDYRCDLHNQTMTITTLREET